MAGRISMWNFPKDSKGWTIFPASGRKVYVSSSSGNDSNPGTEASPVKTTQKAAQLGNHWLLKTGDVWPSLASVPSGPSSDKPTIVTSYGGGARPMIRNDKKNVVNLVNKKNIVISGIHFRADKRKPGDAGFDPATYHGLWVYNTSHLWLEDCKIELYGNAMSAQG